MSKRWRPRIFWTTLEDAAWAKREGRDERLHYYGPLSCWSLSNDKGFAIGRLSFHILNMEVLDA